MLGFFSGVVEFFLTFSSLGFFSLSRCGWLRSAWVCLVGFAWFGLWFDECVCLVRRGFAWSDLHQSIVFRWWMATVAMGLVAMGLMSVGVCVFVVGFVTDVMVVVGDCDGGGC